MDTDIRLIATTDPEREGVYFYLAFAAPPDDGDETCAAAILEFGDGDVLDLGIICAPTNFTWRTQREIPLGRHTYSALDDDSPQICWGSQTASCALPWRAPTAETVIVPEIDLFSLRPLADEPFQFVLELAISGLPDHQSVRIDGGSGPTMRIEGAEEDDFPLSWLLDYDKPGKYTVAVDLLDGDGFHLATLVEESFEVEEPVEVPPSAEATLDDTIDIDVAPDAVQTPVALSAVMVEASPLSSESVPWLPFRYARPLWAWARTYTTAGGSRVSRSLASGTFLAIRQETEVNGDLWYQTGTYDWIPASSVSLMQTSALRGVEVGAPPPEVDPEPEPEPKPKPTTGRRGRVIANVLNVRAEPGVRASNPRIDRLLRNTEVDIYDEETVAGAIWYRVGEGRWVHSGWVLLIETSPETEPEPEPNPEPEPATQAGQVTANVLNVRATPGVRADNPPIDRLLYGVTISIFEERIYSGATWYRIGEERWVYSGWVRLVEPSADLVGNQPPHLVQEDRTNNVILPVGWVVSSALRVRSQPGYGDDSTVVDVVQHNQRLDIIETRVVNGESWYRIGEYRWVHSGWVGVAREKARPASIGAGERWIGVNLSEQTVVAYEGDRPVYAALAATGLPGTSTVRGIFRTWLRLESRKMSGGSGSRYYYLEEVTWTCYFYGGYALHTAYWHDAFGRPRSHGCVNLSPYDAWWLFQWSEPGGDRSPAVYVYWS